MIILLLYVAMILVMFAGLWKIFEKANKPGWASLIPFYNMVIWFEIIGKPLWQIILVFIPFANIYVAVTMCIGMCRSYGKSGIGNYLAAIFFCFIYIPYLGFTEDIKYVGPAESVNQPQAA